MLRPYKAGGNGKEKASQDAATEERSFATLRMTRQWHASNEGEMDHLADPETKMDLGIIMWTPLFPSTSSVMCKSAATLESM